MLLLTQNDDDRSWIEQTRRELQRPPDNGMYVGELRREIRMRNAGAVVSCPDPEIHERCPRRNVVVVVATSAAAAATAVCY